MLKQITKIAAYYQLIYTLISQLIVFKYTLYTTFNIYHNNPFNKNLFLVFLKKLNMIDNFML